MDENFNNGGVQPTPPNQGNYYVPPTAPPQPNVEVQQPIPVAPPQPKQVSYYTPPAINANPPQPKKEEPQTQTHPPQNEVVKKKNKTVIVLGVIIAICVAVALVGIVISTMNPSVGNNKPDSSESSPFDDFNIDDEDELNDDSGASATIESSNEASKTDEYGNLTAAGVVEKSIDSCVGLTVYSEQSSYNYFYNYGNDSGSNEEEMTGEGSGVIMSESNGKTYIMTCAHVIEDASSCKVTLNNGDKYDGVIVGYDSQTDIGVVSIDKTGLQIATFGDSRDIEQGESCVAIGCPAGLQFMNSVTQGIVSALDRPVSSSIGYSNTCIQVDAAINPGNSGGALFNMQGQVIGINSSKIASTEYEGMGFAVPSNTAVKTANSLIKYGYVSGRAKIGITYNSIQNYNNSSAILSSLDSKGFKDAKGAMVIQDIERESGLYGKAKQYDIIIAVDGKTLTSTDVMTSYLSNHSPGDKCKLTIARIENNKIDTFDVTVDLIESK